MQVPGYQLNQTLSRLELLTSPLLVAVLAPHPREGESADDEWCEDPGQTEQEAPGDVHPVPGADKVVSGDGEDGLQEQGGPGGGVEGEGGQGAVDVVLTAVPGGKNLYPIHGLKMHIKGLILLVVSYKKSLK